MMKNPAHPGGLIRDNIEDLGLSVAEAAKGLGVTRQQLYRLISGRHGVTPEMALRLEQAFGGSADAWIFPPRKNFYHCREQLSELHDP